jgi:hypothetical protein
MSTLVTPANQAGNRLILKSQPAQCRPTVFTEPPLQLAVRATPIQHIAHPLVASLKFI